LRTIGDETFERLLRRYVVNGVVAFDGFPGYNLAIANLYFWYY